MQRSRQIKINPTGIAHNELYIYWVHFVPPFNSTRIQAMEESFQRREEKSVIQHSLLGFVAVCVGTELMFLMAWHRWKEELEGEMSHRKKRIEQLERDKTNSVLALRKKIDTLEIENTNEIAQLQEIHRYIVFHVHCRSNHW